MASGKEVGVARVAGLRYWRAADARVVVDAWRRSGEGVRAFAERHRLHPRRLSRWAKRLGEEAVEPVRFHPMRVVYRSEVEHRSAATLEIVVGEGLRVRVASGFAAEDLERVLAVLEARC
jgi:hypothetical protein